MIGTVFLDGRAVPLAPTALLGQGGEAEVYDLGDGTVVKAFKPPAHPDFAGQPDVQAQVAARLAEHQRKLPAFPAGLPAQVIAPIGLAFAERAERTICGYRMPKVAGEPLFRIGEQRWRHAEGATAADVLPLVRELEGAVTALHAAGVVLGDFNDLNVLVERAAHARRLHLIDADSYQFAGFACTMFSERFLDPRLCKDQLVPVAPHDRESDWFAFHVMALRTLLLVGPWGGVYRPADPAARCAPDARPLRRISIFHPEVVLPRGALPPAALPDELRAHFAAVFRGDRAGPPPRRLFAELRFVRCATCGAEHGHPRCPACVASVAVAAPPAGPTQLGKLSVRPVHPRVFFHESAGLAKRVEEWPAGYEPPLSPAAPQLPEAWMQRSALWRGTKRGPVRVGGVLAGRTWAWRAPTFGCGFYRARNYTVAFTFEREHGVLDDRARLPLLPGELASAHAVLSEERAWMFLTLAHRGRLTTAALVLERSGQLAACVVDVEAAAATSEEERERTAAWLAGLHGACASGRFLFGPTDAGLVRLEVTQQQLTVTRSYPETATLMCAADRLVFTDRGLLVHRRDDALLLTFA